jgi:hypothetical protein
MWVDMWAYRKGTFSGARVCPRDPTSLYGTRLEISACHIGPLVAP